MVAAAVVVIVGVVGSVVLVTVVVGTVVVGVVVGVVMIVIPVRVTLGESQGFIFVELRSTHETQCHIPFL